MCNIFGKYLSFVSLLSTFSHGADILAILPTPSYSHQIAYTELWKQLSLRGHKVTLITTDPVKDPKLTNLTEIDMKWMYKFFTNNGGKEAQEEMTMWNLLEMVEVMLYHIIDPFLKHAPIQDLIRNKRHFDVVMVEFTCPELLAFAELYNCPKILFSSADTFQNFHQAIGNPTHPVLHNIMTPFLAPLSFRERLISTVHYLHVWHFCNYRLFTRREQLVQKYFNTSLTVAEMIKDIDMMFLNVNPVIQEVRAVGPTTINIGDPRRAVASKPLPEDLAEFLDSAKEGFIYFSLGSNVKSKNLKEESLNAITETLGDVSYKVLWKFEADSLPGKPKNVKLVKWAPQQSVLSHPNIKLFVTQGGLQSMEEAIYGEVPSVVIPFFADQDQNARLMEKKGFAKVIGRQPSINKEELKAAILEVINNPKYKNAVKRIKQLALDTPMTGVENAIWWTEYVIRHKGAKHLRNPTADLPFYQFYLLDVIGFLFAFIIFVLSVLYALIRKLVLVLLKYIQKPTSTKKKLQ